MVPDEPNTTPMDQVAQEAEQESNSVKQFAVKLFQEAEVHTETFMIEAADEAEALAKAGEIVATKDLENVKHRLEAHLEDAQPSAGGTSEQQAEQPTPAEPEQPAPDTGTQHPLPQSGRPEGVVDAPDQPSVDSSGEQVNEPGPAQQSDQGA